MSRSANELNIRNAKILQQNVFYHDLCKVSKLGFQFFREGMHHHSYLFDLVHYTHIVYNIEYIYIYI